MYRDRHIKDDFNFGQGHLLRQSIIVDYRGAYFAAKKLRE